MSAEESTTTTEPQVSQSQPEAVEHTQEPSDTTKQEPKQEPKREPDEFERLQDEPDEDEEGNERTYPMRKAKESAAKVLELKKQIAELEEKQSKFMVPRIDRESLAGGVGSPDDYASHDDYMEALDRHMSSKAGEQFDYMREISHNRAMLDARIFMQNPGLQEHSEAINNLHPLVQGLLANSEWGVAFLSHAESQGIIDRLHQFHPAEVRDVLRGFEGEMSAQKRAFDEGVQRSYSERQAQIREQVKELTNGKVDGGMIAKLGLGQEAIYGIMRSSSPAAVVMYLDENPQALESIKGLDRDGALIAIGEMTGRAMAFTRSEDFKAKYGQPGQYKADQNLRGGATASQRPEDTQSSEQFNRVWNAQKRKNVRTK